MTLLQPFQRAADFILTVLLWAYFLFGFLVLAFFLFLPFYMKLQSSQAVLQKLNHLHLEIFFASVRVMAPAVKFRIDERARNLRSAIIVCNHISYLDPILLVSLYARHTTIVKNTFFSVPIFGWFLRKAGYVPSSPSEMFGPAMINHLENIKRHLAEGGNLFVFPEGTRSRHGRLLPFNKGVFSIARYCHKPLNIVYLSGTERLFPPGGFSFRMFGKKVISVKWIASLEPDYAAGDFSLAAVSDEARQIFKREMAGLKAKPGQGRKTEG